jgi:2-(1,2-epoxy-1,2-dihydrophenyl)acetyl-CoA isomerase
MKRAYESSTGLGLSVSDGVLRAVLDRPQRRNAFDDMSLTALIAAFEVASMDEELRCVVLTGSGEHFCGGFDIIGRNADATVKPRTGSISRRLPLAAHRLLTLVLEIQLPVVCVVRGWAVGLGAQLAVAADVTVADERARLWWPFVDRGFTPDSGATWLLPRLVGAARARDLLLRAREISGREAADWGLVQDAVPAAELEVVAERVVSKFAAGPTVALGITKALLNASPDNDLARHLAAEAAAMELSSRSPDFREGIAALTEKRPPRFHGR